MTELYGLIFDVDGVIGNTEPINAQATIKVFQDIFDIHNAKAADFEAGLGRGAKKYVEAGAITHGLKLTPDQITHAANARMQNILQLIRTQGLPSFPGVRELAQNALNHQNFRVAIASSAEKELVYAILNAVNMPYQQIPCLTADDVTHKKPDPELFCKAAQKIDLPPQKCVVIEDAPNGVQAAHNAQCKCIAVTNSATPEKLADADLIVKDLTEVSLDTLTQLINKT